MEKKHIFTKGITNYSEYIIHILWKSIVICYLNTTVDSKCRGADLGKRAWQKKDSWQSSHNLDICLWLILELQESYIRQEWDNIPLPKVQHLVSSLLDCC